MYRLPDNLRASLKKPLSPVLSGAGAVSDAQRASYLVTVGDVVTQTFLDAGRVPDVMVVDFKTQREHDLPELREAVAATGARVVHVRNPAAEVTRDMWDALTLALSADEKTVLQVDGEEDLAVLPALVLARDGSIVAYGQPHEGVVLVNVDARSRAFARDFLKQMEV